MGSELRRLLSGLDDGLTRLQRTVLTASWLPGQPVEAVSATLTARGLASHAAVEAYFGWHGGSGAGPDVPADDLHLLPGFYMLSLEDAAAFYDAMRTDPRWNSAWLPLLTNGGGDFYLADLSTSSASVRHFRLEESDHPVEFATLEDFIRTLVAAFDGGTFFVDADGYLEMDDLAFAELAARLNPSVPWWTDPI